MCIKSGVAADGYTANTPSRPRCKNMITETLTLAKLAEMAGKFVFWIRKQRTRPAETVAGRFIRLFESHDVHRNQIPRFLGRGLTLRDIQDESSLLDKLDEPMLDAVCDLFAVRREWLEGAEDLIYPCHDFYKRPEAVAPFLAALKANNPDGQLDGVLLAPDDEKGDALIILSEIVGWIGDKPVYRNHLLNNWLFDYWKSRTYLTACVASAWKNEVYLRGFYAPGKEIKRTAGGEHLLGANGDWAAPRKNERLYPEDMALKPEAFLAGIDPEQSNYGTASALELWLKLEEDGHMATGLSMYDGASVRKLFEEERDKWIARSSSHR